MSDWVQHHTIAGSLSKILAAERDFAGDANEFVVTTSGHKLDVIGNGFDYDATTEAPKSAGSIASMILTTDDDDTPLLTITDLNQHDLGQFWATWQSTGAKAALDYLLGSTDQTGTAGDDYLETYGSASKLAGLGGDNRYDVFHSNTEVVDGAGDMTLAIKAFVFNLDVAGGGGRDKVVTDSPSIQLGWFTGIEVYAFGATPGFKTIFGNVNQLPGGFSPHVKVNASPNNVVNGFILSPAGSGSQTVDYSGVDAHGGRANTTFTFSMSGASKLHLIGVEDWRNIVFGTPGKDFLRGGKWNDELTGGMKADRFDFDSVAQSPKGAKRDTIMDFSHGQHDKIDLHTIDADQRAANPGNDDFVFIGSKTFSAYHAAHPAVFGMVRFSGGVLQANVNAKLAADLEIKVLGAHIVANDLVM